MRLAGLIALAACGGGAPANPGDDGAVFDDGAPTDALVTLDPTPGTYRETCDGSGAVAIDFTHFLDVDDEDQGVRIYERGADAAPVQQLDLTAQLEVGDDEADLEDLARLGDRIYAITSHGRNKDGELIEARYRFAALDVTGALPELGVTVVGPSTTLLADLLVAANWDAPDADVIAALDAASQLDDDKQASLAPEDQGTNIEGLAALPDGTLAIGFRNPQPGGDAIVVTLANADAVLGGATARFAGATRLDLGGLGVRGMAYSPAHGAVVIVAGSRASGGPFRLYTWGGGLADPAVLAGDLAAPADSAPEAVVTYPNSKDVQIVFDQGDVTIGDGNCKDALAEDRRFTDAIVHVD